MSQSWENGVTDKRTDGKTDGESWIHRILQQRQGLNNSNKSGKLKSLVTTSTDQPPLTKRL